MCRIFALFRCHVTIRIRANANVALICYFGVQVCVHIYIYIFVVRIRVRVYVNGALALITCAIDYINSNQVSQYTMTWM